MVFGGAVLLILWLFLVPGLAGVFFAGGYKGYSKYLFMWVSGQILLWAVFFVLGVPMILAEADFENLVCAYVACVAFILAGAIFYLLKFPERRDGEKKLKVVGKKENKTIFSAGKLFFAIALFLLLVQLVLAVIMTYGDGDDAYYVAVSTITQDSGTMYLKSVYSVGWDQGMDYRHALAPFPIWIAFLSRLSGLKTAVTAHVVVSSVMILMANVIYFLIGGRFFKGARRSLFLIFAQLLILFGDYSFYTAENFLIARSRQGKAALSSILLPAFFLLFFLVMHYLKNEKKVPFSMWFLLLCLQLSSALCSTQGILLSSMLVLLWGMCTAVSYKKWKILIPCFLSCVPGGIVALVYMLH